MRFLQLDFQNREKFKIPKVHHICFIWLFGKCVPSKRRELRKINRAVGFVERHYDLIEIAKLTKTALLSSFV